MLLDANHHTVNQSSGKLRTLFIATGSLYIILTLWRISDLICVLINGYQDFFPPRNSFYFHDLVTKSLTNICALRVIVVNVDSFYVPL